MSNFIEEVPQCSADSGVTFKPPRVIQAAQQSNGWDCGCHAIMNMRALASTAVLDEMDWTEMALPVGVDTARDDVWRERVAEECLARTVQLASTAPTL